MTDKILTVIIGAIGIVWLTISILIFLAPVILILAAAYWLVKHA